MVRKTYTPGQIINKLREVEILVDHGNTLAMTWKKIGVGDCTYYRWREEYGGMRVDRIHGLKELEQENSCLKRLVADLSLDKLGHNRLDCYLIVTSLHNILYS